MPRDLVGTVWAVSTPSARAALVLAGPFRAADGRPEYMISPLYTGRESGFLWSDEDLQISAHESPFDETRFAGIWNVRPALEDDLVIELGSVTGDALTDIRDAYWASLNEEHVSVGPRAGRVRVWQRARVSRFREAEVQLWAALSGHVHDTAAEHPTLALLWNALNHIVVQYAQHEEVFGGAAMRVTPSDDSLEWILPEPQGLRDVQGGSVLIEFTASPTPRLENPAVGLRARRERILSFSTESEILSPPNFTGDVNTWFELMRGVA